MGSKWRTSTWGDEISLEYGKALRNYDKERGLFRVFGSNGPIGWTAQPLAPGPGVILGRKGAYRGIEFSREPFFVIDTAYYVVPKTELDMRWLYYAIKHHKLGEIDDGSPIPSTTRSAVYVRELDIPPLAEQKAIACILGSLDDKIELNRRMNKTLEEMARAIFKSWFVDFDPVHAKAAVRCKHPDWSNAQVSRAACPNLKPEIAELFPDTFEDPDICNIPSGWQMVTVGEAFRLVMGQSPPGSTYNEMGEGLPFYQGRTDFGFRFPTCRVHCTEPTRLADPGDTLVSVRAPVGDINIAIEKCAVGRGVAAVRHLSGSQSLTYYSMRNLSKLFDKFEGEGTVFGSINKTDFAKLPFIEPPPSILKAFDHHVTSFDRQIEVLERESRALSATRDALLPKLISGELPIKDAERIAGRCV